MELLQHLLPNQTDLALTCWNLDAASGQIILELSSTQHLAECPLCHCSSHRVHSHYERTLKDLPLAQYSLVILLGVCKFFVSMTLAVVGSSVSDCPPSSPLGRDVPFDTPKN